MTKRQMGKRKLISREFVEMGRIRPAAAGIGPLLSRATYNQLVLLQVHALHRGYVLGAPSYAGFLGAQSIFETSSEAAASRKL